MNRIAIVGTTGSGKSSLAREISQHLNIPHIELDSLFWEPNWTQADTEVFRERASAALSGDVWVVDGNYSQLRDIVWHRADTLIWLDYPLSLIIWRLWRRTLRRIITREVLWANNRETWRNAFLSGDSLFLWAIKSKAKYRRTYPLTFQQPQYAHLNVIHLKSPQEAKFWLKTIGKTDHRANRHT